MLSTRPPEGRRTTIALNDREEGDERRPHGKEGMNWMKNGCVKDLRKGGRKKRKRCNELNYYR
jgi:hypothetical protein